MTEQEKRELEAYYENQFLMFRSEGWKDFEATVKASMMKDFQIEKLHNAEDLHKAQGSLNVLRWILQWPAFCEEAYRQNFGEANEEDV